jgi:hypothetical protein
MFDTCGGIGAMVRDLTLRKQVTSGFRRVGGLLLGIAWLGLVYWGITEGFASEQAFSEGRHPSRFLGYALLIVAAVIMVATAEYWKRAFPGIMLAAVINSVLELWRGHAVNNPSVAIAPPTAAIHLLVTSGVTVLTLTFKSRHLSMTDRVALLAFVAAFFWQAVDSRFASLKLVGGAFCVLVAWAINRLRSGRTAFSPSS